MTAVLPLVALSTHAYDFEVGGLYYNVLSDSTVEVTYKNRTPIFEFTKDYEGELIIPSEIKYETNNYKVVAIGDFAFYGCDSLLFIDIPKGVTAIGYESFRGCMGLAQVTIPQGLTLIDSNAFYDCVSLRSINIPHSVKQIKGATFANCEKLKDVYIEDLDSWFKIDFEGGYYCNPLYNGANLYLNNEKLSSLTVPNDITDISDYIFNGCTSLKTVKIPEGVKSIGRSSFDNCI